MMEDAYLGESFVLRFSMQDARNPDRAVSSAEYQVKVGEDIITDGTMDTEGNEGSFRFSADRVGIHEITVTYHIGLDTWKAKFRINVVDA